MYKLFLCLRYLRRRYLALIGVVSVALCVFMMLVAVSVMDGFLRKVELAAKGLFGDIIIDGTTLSGIGRYDEFIAELTGEYRVDGRFRRADTGGGAAMVFQAEASAAQVEALAGRVEVRAGKLGPDRAYAYPARAAAYRQGRHVGELAGQLTLEADGRLVFTSRSRLAGRADAARAASRELLPASSPRSWAARPGWPDLRARRRPCA